MNPILITIVAVVFFILYLVGTYNGLVVLKTRIEEAFSGIDVQLKRRSDLIPNLVETVKGYAKHEKTVYENVTKARSALISAESPRAKAQANDQLTQALKSLFAVAEAYPDLKANENFKELQRQLEDTEDKIAYSRQFYNSNVLEYNTRVKIFPSNLIANLFKFQPAEFFAAEEEERKKIAVKFE